MKNTYFDYNATTPLHENALHAMLPFLKEVFGNPSSSHEMGRQPSRAIRVARRQVCSLLGIEKESELIFTSGGTESNNAAIRAALSAAPEKKHLITSSVEHSSVLKLCRELGKIGYDVTEIGVDANGSLDLTALFSAIRPETALVSLMFANNETGVIFPIDEIGKKLRKQNVLFHVDAVQAVGKIPITLSDFPIDYMSVSGHKIYGPKGVGGLYVRSGVPFSSLIWGGSHERGRRAGTENVAGVAGFGKACEIIEKDLADESIRLCDLRSYFEETLIKEIPDVVFHGSEVSRLVNTSNAEFPDIESETLLMLLDQEGIFVSSGSACMSGASDPSHVLLAMGLSEERAKSSLRFSFGRSTQKQDVEVLIQKLSETILKLRNNSKKVTTKVSAA